MRWEDPSDHPTPSLYAGRVYTRQHWVDFEICEGGYTSYRTRYAAPRLLFSGYASVFDVPGTFNQGWTAVGPKDGAYSQADQYLSVLGVVKDNGYYIISPSFWQTAVTPGAFSPMAPVPGYSDQIMDVDVRAVQSPDGLTPGFDTLDNPKCFKNGPNGFEAGGYHVWYYNGQEFSRPYHWYSSSSGSKKAPIAVTKEYASKMGYASIGSGVAKTTRARILYDYIYGLTAVSVAPVGEPQDGKQRWQAYFFNSTPFLAKNVKLRAYLKQNGKYTLVANTTTEIGPIPIGDGEGGIVPVALSPRYGNGVRRGDFQNQIVWEFEVPVPSDAYSIIVSANLQFTESGTMLREPLTTVTAYGMYGANISGLTGTKNEVAPQIVIRGGTAYDDNWVESNEQSGWTPPSENGPVVVYPDDLAAVKIEVLDSDGNPVTQLQGGTPYKIKAVFQSGFDVGGFARLRLYRYDIKNERLYLVEEKYGYLHPDSTEIVDFGNYAWGPGLYTLIATVCYRNDGNDPTTNWVAEKFDGKYTEVTYDNNKITLNIGVGESPYSGKPQPSYWSYNLYYPPERTETVEIYEEITEPVYGWKEVPFTKEEGKGDVRVRLVE